MNIYRYLIFLETRIMHFAADSMDLSSFFVEIFMVGPVTVLFLQEWRFGRSRSSKVIDFGTNRKRVYDFILVGYSNLVSVPFRRYCSFCAPDPTPILGCSRWTVEQIAHVGVIVSRYLKLFGREIIFEVPGIPTCVKKNTQRHRRRVICAAQHIAR